MYRTSDVCKDGTEHYESVRVERVGLSKKRMISNEGNQRSNPSNYRRGGDDGAKPASQGKYTRSARCDAKI